MGPKDHQSIKRDAYDFTCPQGPTYINVHQSIMRDLYMILHTHNLRFPWRDG